MEPAPPFIPWIRMETICSCLRRNCKHKREDARRNAALDDLEALTTDDLRWLTDNGWAGPGI